jgi:hypothetical protein
MPLDIGFADLFDHIGTASLGYSAKAGALNGRMVAIEGFLAHAHGPEPALSLVNEPGVCPDCAPAPVPTIALPGASPAPGRVAGEVLVRVTGRLSYGFHIDPAGTASILRIEAARVRIVESSACGS